MEVNIFFGFICSNPACGTTINIGMDDIISEQVICYNCKSEMIPNNNATPIGLGVTCNYCGFTAALIDSDTCPNCNKKFG